MARKEYEVRRSMIGDKEYARGDTRVMDENDARHFVERGHLKLIGDAPESELKPVEEMTRAELVAEILAGTRTHIESVDDDELRAGVNSYRRRASDGSDDGDEPALGDMTVDQLKDLAAKEEIDLTGKTLKADIVAAIEAARNA